MFEQAQCQWGGGAALAAAGNGARLRFASMVITIRTLLTASSGHGSDEKQAAGGREGTCSRGSRPRCRGGQGGPRR